MAENDDIEDEDEDETIEDLEVSEDDADEIKAGKHIGGVKY